MYGENLVLSGAGQLLDKLPSMKEDFEDMKKIETELKEDLPKLYQFMLIKFKEAAREIQTKLAIADKNVDEKQLAKYLKKDKVSKEEINNILRMRKLNTEISADQFDKSNEQQKDEELPQEVIEELEGNKYKEEIQEIEENEE